MTEPKAALVEVAKAELWGQVPDGTTVTLKAVLDQRDLLANAVVHVIGRPGRPGECPICRGAEPCDADQPAIQLAAGMFAGASEADLRGHPS